MICRYIYLSGKLRKHETLRCSLIWILWSCADSYLLSPPGMNISWLGRSYHWSPIILSLKRLLGTLTLLSRYSWHLYLSISTSQECDLSWLERVRIEYPAVTMIAPHRYNGGNPIISKKLVPHHPAPAAAAAGCKEMKMYTRPIIPWAFDSSK